MRLIVRDEDTAGGAVAENAVELPEGATTVRELLRSRIEQEVARFNASRGQVFQGLVEPTGAERTLNGPRVLRQVRWEPQFEAAVEAFERTRLLVIVDGRQLEDLDAPLEVAPDTEVVFLRLVPLAGG